MGLSVESQMPMDIMLNPSMADEPPAHVDKMESIFMKGDQIKNIKSMNIDETEIMESINKQNLMQQIANDDEHVFDESDLVVMGKEQPVGFSIANDAAMNTETR